MREKTEISDTTQVRGGGEDGGRSLGTLREIPRHRDIEISAHRDTQQVRKGEEG